jgi:hypothetical protein
MKVRRQDKDGEVHIAEIMELENKIILAHRELKAFVRKTWPRLPLELRSI